MNRNKRLFKNTLIYFIGGFSSSILSFLLLPLYTTYLSPEDYGKVDLIFTYASILIPLFTLQITFAGFRFLFDAVDEKEKKIIISSTFFVHIIGMLIFSLLYVVFWFRTKNEFGILIITYVLINDLASTLTQIARGLKKNTIYAITGTIGTAVQLLSNIIFIIGLGLKSTALILSPVISFFVIAITILLFTNIRDYMSCSAIDKNKIKSMLKYSIPLVPDSICWWVLLGFGRIFLNYTHGTSMVGIYAVANKFPSVITMFYSIFNKAWQENSFSEYNMQDRDQYYSKMYNGLISFLFPIIIVSMPLIKIIYPLMISNKFGSAYLYIPILFLSALISILSTFYGSGFESAKQTNGIMVSTFIAMLTNVTFNLLLVPKYAIYGVSIALVLSYLSLFIFRVIRSKKYFTIVVNKRLVFLSSFILLVSMVIYYIDNLSLQIIMIVIGSIYFLILNNKLVMKILIIITKKRNRG